jgi:hypothetical protein
MALRGPEPEDADSGAFQLSGEYSRRAIHCLAQVREPKSIGSALMGLDHG